MQSNQSVKFQALSLIRDEHRSLAAVVHALQFLAERLKKGAPADTTLLGAITHYLTQFPEQLHHPAEDRWLFAPLRAKTKEGSAVLDILEAEHEAGDERAVKLALAVSELAANVPGAVDDFVRVVDQYAQFYWGHMLREETLIFPLAERYLTDEDWTAAVDGFKANCDPMFGGDTAEEFGALFRRIVYLAPAPIGMGGKG